MTSHAPVGGRDIPTSLPTFVSAVTRVPTAWRGIIVDSRPPNPVPAASFMPSQHPVPTNVREGYPHTGVHPSQTASTSGAALPTPLVGGISTEKADSEEGVERPQGWSNAYSVAIGAVLGALVVGALVIWWVVWWKRQKRKEKHMGEAEEHRAEGDMYPYGVGSGIDRPVRSADETRW